MQSSNPIFTRSEGFNGRNAYGNQTYPGNGQTYPGYGNDPSQWGTGTPGGGHDVQVDQGRMTIDSVVQKTGITLFVVVLFAAGTWFMTPEVTSESAMGSLYGLSMLGALGGFALAMVNSFKKVISPALVLAYAAFEGVFVGAFSKVLETVFAQPGQEPGGLVIGAVLGTMAAVAGTLAAYKFFNIKVGKRFCKWVMRRGARLRGAVRAGPGAELLRQQLRLQRLRHHGPDHERHRSRPRCADADPRLRLRRARASRPVCRSASRGGRPSV